MNRRAALCLFAALALAPLPGRAQDPKALAGKVMQAMGGQKAWEETRFLHFTFAGRRAHWWDKWTGRHRVEGQTQAGEKYVVLENINTQEGTAYLNGQKVEGEKAQEMLKNAYGAWVNDTYWLLMPYKLQDPGVNLAYDGEETIDGTTYDKLALSFGNVGLTPGDRYWAYLNRNTGLMDRWAFLLQDMPKDGPPSVWSWTGWEPHGKIKLAPHRQQLTGGDRKLELGEIAVSETMPDAVFTSPEPVK